MQEEKEDLIGRFDLLDERLNQENKNIELIAKSIRTIKQSLQDFTRTLDRSMTPLRLYTQTKEDDSWTCTIKAVIESIESYCKVTLKAAESFTSDPLEKYLNEYAQKNKDCINKGNKLLQQIKQNRTKVIHAKENYKPARKEMEIGRTDSKQAKNEAQILSEALIRFRNSIVEFNGYLLNTEPTYKDQVEFLKQNEEEKTIFIREHLKSYFENLVKISANQLETFENIKDKCKELKPDRVFITPSMKVPRERLFGFISFDDEMKAIRKADMPADLFDTPGSSMMGKEVWGIEFMEEMGSNLLEQGVALNKEQKEKIVAILKSESARASFVSIFYNNYHHCKSKEVLNDLADITNTMLEESYKHPLDCSLVWPIVANSYKTRYENPHNKLRIRLIKLLAKNPIWKERVSLMKLVEYKLMQTNEERKSEENNLLGMFWSVGSKFLFGEEDSIGTTKATRNIANAYNELLNIALYLLALEVDMKVGIEILIEFAHRYNLTTDKLCQLLDDYQSGQPLLEKNLIEGKELVKLSLKKNKRQGLKFGEKVILVHAIKYIDDKPELRNLLLLSKNTSNLLRKKVYRQALSLIDNDRRHQIWKLLIFSKETCDQYSKLKEGRIDSFKHFNESLDNLIKMDVERSFYKQNEEVKLVTLLDNIGNT